MNRAWHTKTFFRQGLLPVGKGHAAAGLSEVLVLDTAIFTLELADFAAGAAGFLLPFLAAGLAVGFFAAGFAAAFLATGFFTAAVLAGAVFLMGAAFFATAFLTGAAFLAGAAFFATTFLAGAF